MIKKSIVSILVILLFFHSFGCISYNRILPYDKEVIENANAVKFTTVDNEEIIMKEVRVENDKFTGYPWLTSDYSKERREFSKEKILKIEVEQFNTGSTLLLFGGIVGVGLLLYALSWHYHPFAGSESRK